MANAWAMRPLPFAAVGTSGAVAPGYAAANMGNDFAGVVFKSAGGDAGNIIYVDLGSAQVVDAAVFLGCTGASAAWTLHVQSADDAGFTVNAATVGTAGVPFLAGATFPTHGRGVGYWEAPAAVTPRRHWRFMFNGLAGAPLTIARLAIGQRLQLARNFGFGGAFGVRDLGNADWSPTGAFLRRRAAKLRTIGLSFTAVHKDEVEQKVQPLIELQAGQEPIVLVTDPAAHALRQTRIYWGLMIGELGTIWRGAHAWEWRVNLVDLVPIPKAA